MEKLVFKLIYMYLRFYLFNIFMIYSVNLYQYNKKVCVHCFYRVNKSKAYFFSQNATKVMLRKIGW